MGYFHHEYVRRRNWLDEKRYADLVALCHCLPGPASSQVGIGIGIIRAGWIGGCVAWLGFTLPSILAMLLVAYAFQSIGIGNAGWLHGLKLVAVAVIAHAITGMWQKLIADRLQATIAVGAAAVALVWHSVLSQLVLLLAAGLIGWLRYRQADRPERAAVQIPLRRTAAICSLVLFAGLLAVLPLLRQWSGSHLVGLLDSFYRAGALVFGGGHVVLPLLEREVIPAGWITGEDFLAGYAVAQAVPGPLFTFATYLGMMINGWSGALVATCAIFLPGFLLVAGALPFWEALRGSSVVQSALTGIHAAVVGILLATLYDPVWTSSILSSLDVACALFLFLLLAYWKTPPWLVVIAGALGGTLLDLI